MTKLKRECSCGGIDIGVGVMHEPHCDLNDDGWIHTLEEKVEALEADLEAERRENAILNQTLKLMATEAQKDCCPDEHDCVDEGDCILHEDAGEQDCIRCWLDYFRVEAEKGK